MTVRHAAAVAAAGALLVGPAGAVPVAAQGHGPVFGLSTPTLGKGGWSLDVTAMGRWLEGGSTAMLRPMVSHGLTEDVQLSVSFPVVLARDATVHPARGLTRMPASQDVELAVGWRFQRAGIGVGARRETTLWLALDEPLGRESDGGPRPRSLFGAAATGYASRSVYLWLGAGYGRPLRGSGSTGGEVGSVTMGSLVVGYRPERFRGEVPGADWRAFVEVVGERWGAGPGEVPGGDLEPRRQLLVAFTLLGLYGSWGIAGGPAVPVYQDHPRGGREDRVRLALNGVLWF